MNLKTVLAELAEGIALGFAEEVVNQLNAEAAIRSVNPQARAIGRQLADGMLGKFQQPRLVAQSGQLRRVHGELFKAVCPPTNASD